MFNILGSTAKYTTTFVTGSGEVLDEPNEKTYLVSSDGDYLRFFYEDEGKTLTYVHLDLVKKVIILENEVELYNSDDHIIAIIHL